MEQNKPLKIAHPGILPIHCPYLNLKNPGLLFLVSGRWKSATRAPVAVSRLSTREYFLFILKQMHDFTLPSTSRQFDFLEV